MLNKLVVPSNKPLLVDTSGVSIDSKVYSTEWFKVNVVKIKTFYD